ncbi:Stk1 family PASTA domain-containing Ser/Thr kinase [Ornithinibacillus sp. L9]|uniref:Serine/threonine-protein kinase PrkC n=1 Tax=Ornithinibacillus caprae TaxID=2678566 RepID=A0A6N8FJV7_9BACI|nr:Stk1 family PASTA domain-containing Ser/Thr kinase [Ornithinibacillus caprae]MUK89481.1 Stk1 family PASTA domain-containing Ser/Thr kinase [Ornithinibacillus caprae]
MLKGHLLNDRYRIKDTIGGGGMADVYLAKDIILDRDVAIKVLRMEYANDEEFIARFDREAQSATSLSHPNIVSIYDVGEEDKILFMAMEYVDGMTLKEYIQRYGPIDVPEAIDIMKQITSAIAHAHENEIVHRDIKPQNILIDTYGHIKVTDFGIAMALSATSLTQTNSVLGSVHYLSPEQARGGLATKKSDIYSLGIVFFELLTGRLPFSGQSPVSIALKHLQSETPSVRRFNQEVPQSVENIVLRATAKDPFHRFNTVYDMETSLESALDPSKLNEDRYAPPSEVGEETKAIPIITDNQLLNHEHQDTIVHQTNGDTKKVEDEKPHKKEKGNKPKKKKDKNKKKSRKKKWIITSIILFILLASIVAALFIIPGIMKPKEVTIPDVTEWEYEDAVDELESLNLNVEQEEIFSEDIEEGYVVKTDPRAGRSALENSTVTVFVSQGKEKEEFEDYVGRDYSQVKRLLEQKGYKEVESQEKHSDKPEGEIIAHVDPYPGSEVVPSETTVIFEVSIGPELVELNNLRGLTEAEAEDYLDSVGLKMKRHEENSDSVPEGQVIRHSPDANASLEKGEEVDVYISTGPEEIPPRSHSVTFTVPYFEESGTGEDDEENPDESTDEPKEQQVLIYIDDMDNSMDTPAREEMITQDTRFTITLLIEPGSSASYRVTRDGEEIFNETIPYEEGD